MQEESAATIASQKDVLLLSPTGSGKTLAFLLPLVQLLKKKEQRVQCLVLTPSRELAIQIEQVWKKMTTGFKVSCCYGGHDMQTEIQNLAEPPALLIGTPGRIKDHLTRETFSTEAVNMLVLDEFDKSLALGFEEDMAFIFSKLKQVDKKVFVSATASIDIPAFAGGRDGLVILNHLGVARDEELLLLRKVISQDKDKVNRLAELLSYINEPTLIFCNHRDAVERTAALLKEKGIECAAFHGGMEQMQREQALIMFRNGSMPFLVATDLAARGLDVPEMKHVVHYHLPSTEAEFIHRNGRTARMQASGTASLLLHVEEQLPAYLQQQSIETLDLPEHLKPPRATEWATVYINGGKKDKINKVDIVGLFTKKGKLAADDIGLIIVKDHNAFAAVKKTKVKSLLSLVQDEKIKGSKYRIVLAR